MRANVSSDPRLLALANIILHTFETSKLTAIKNDADAKVPKEEKEDREKVYRKESVDSAGWYHS